MSSSIVRNNYLSAEVLTPDQITALMIGAFASYPAGTLLVRIANFLTRDNLDAAAGGHLFLTSHFKQSRLRIHLHYLWTEVFSNDAPDGTVKTKLHEHQHELNIGSATIANGNVYQPFREPELNSMEAALFPNTNRLSDDCQDYQQFERTGIYALSLPLPMGVQSAELGFHLGPVEDWYEKGFFSYEDFPAKAVSRDPLIKRVQSLIANKTINQANRLIALESSPSFWYAFTIRKFGSKLGRSINELNKLAELHGYPEYFDAQHFIWPSQTMDDSVSEQFNDTAVLGTFLTRRRQLMNAVFSKDPTIASRHILRMFARDYALIVKLRLKFDVAFAAGLLPSKPFEENHRIQNLFGINPVRQAIILRAKSEAMKSLVLYKEKTGHDFLERNRSNRQVAAEIAAHINFKNFRNGNFQQEITDTDCRLLIALLHRVRIYHTLIKLQALDYWTIVEKIGLTEMNHSSKFRFDH